MPSRPAVHAGPIGVRAGSQTGAEYSLRPASAQGAGDVPLNRARPCSTSDIHITA